MKHDETRPPCAGRPLLFESVAGVDHIQAKAICATCPMSMLAACQRLADEQTYHDGTWAGQLYINGNRSTRYVKKVSA